MSSAIRYEPDTICALASAPGPGERGVLRLSGPDSARLVAATCRAGERALVPAARGQQAVTFHDGVGPQPALLLWMPGPGSYTREDVAELHVSGNPFLARAALERLVSLGARPAGAGEFTRRAFLNGRLDLTRAEGVLALVHATNQAERRAATALLIGGLDGRLADLRERFETLRALAEASLDFDEADTGHVPTSELLALGARATTALDEALAWETARAPETVAPRVVLAGPPNAGKSSLFNALTNGDQKALVHSEAGATRDYLTGSWTTGELTVELHDTAGTMVARDGVEEAAQRLARGMAQAADIVLWTVDARDPLPVPDSLADQLVIGLWNQIDRPQAPRTPPPDDWGGAQRWLATSARSGQGLMLLGSVVERALIGENPSAPVRSSGAPLGTPRELGARHRAALREARERLGEATAGLAAGAPLDLVAEGLRHATDALDGIGGGTTPEDLLTRIFARFCIGK